MALVALLAGAAAAPSLPGAESDGPPVSASDRVFPPETNPGGEAGNSETDRGDGDSGNGKTGPREPEPEPEPAVIHIDGYGFWGNRELKKALRLLQPGDNVPPQLDANFIEDSALIIFSKVTGDGYLKPNLTMELALADGGTMTERWDPTMKNLLPRPLSVVRAEFQIDKGRLYYYENLSFTGLDGPLVDGEARKFFITSDSLFTPKSSRVYTPARLERSVNGLRESLVRGGYRAAEVNAGDPELNHITGAVTVSVSVAPGVKTVVEGVSIEILDESTRVETPLPEVPEGQPYSAFWEQGLAQEMRTVFFAAGYPDVTVRIEPVQEVEGAETNRVELAAVIQPGPRVVLGDVRFEGEDRTRESFLRRRVDLKPGEPLNRIEVEQGRGRLTRMGIFDTVGLRYEQGADPGQRSVVYELKEGKRVEFSVLFGYGSYELLRGGFELEQFNLFGLAHRHRLKVVQSIKSSNADYTYTMPELIGEDMDVFLNASGLRREEVTFTREDYGAQVGTRRYLTAIDAEVGARYSYQFLNARDSGVSDEFSLSEAVVASTVFDLVRDKRDNPLVPRSGYKFQTALEVASPALGGDVGFQRVELGGSVHWRVGNGRFVHAGLSHGAAITLGSERRDLPFNKRFFPGGENSVRGYQQGEAAPKNAAGNLTGAETFFLGNFEFEQLITPSWSVVGFFDAVGFAEDLGDYPVNETLYSVGGGIRWKTLIGPARLEYGHNLNRRAGDPGGTVHFSIGFPF